MTPGGSSSPMTMGGSPSSATHNPDGADAVPPIAPNPGWSPSPMTTGGSPSPATHIPDGADAVPPRRKHPARGVFISSWYPTIVFLTVCTKDRQPWLAQAHVHEALVKLWKQATAWLVGRYVLMPDHLHLFCAPNDLNVSLNTWVAYWKRQFSCLHLPGVGGWQRDCWDRRLRTGESYAAKWEYVRQNPVRAGLCANADDWPYQGELNVLEW